MEEHIAKINDALEKSHTIVIGAECEVSYSGRAESFLPLGDRVIMIKGDKTLIVHQPEGSAPVNYMKENTSHSIVTNDDGTWLKSQNLFLKEYLDIKLNKIHFVHSSLLEDGQKILLNGSERDMAEMLCRQPELIEEGFKPLSQEEHTKYGFIDVFGYDKSNKLVVIECKRYSADLKAVSQLRRYVEKIKKSKGLSDDKVRGILAAPKISPNAEKMLNDFGFEFKQVNPPKYRERYDKKQKRLGEF